MKSKKEIEKEFEEKNRVCLVIQSKICELYKDGSCQILQNEIFDSVVTIENETLTGSSCQEYINKKVCGWYPIT